MLTLFQPLFVSVLAEFKQSMLSLPITLFKKNNNVIADADKIRAVCKDSASIGIHA